MAKSCRTPLVEMVASMAGRLATSNRAKRGLYAGKDVGFGNMVSHSNRKTRRMFKPNVHHKRVWSDTLQEMVPFNLTTTALRCIDRAGGLDNYLLGTSDKKLNSESGLLVKRRIEAALLTQKEGQEKSQEWQQQDQPTLGQEGTSSASPPPPPPSSS